MHPTVPDAHCHLADLADPGAAVAHAAAHGVGPILAVSMGPDDGSAVLDLARRHAGRVIAGVGLHPSRVPGLTDQAVEDEIALLVRRLPDAAFLGEVGLDFKDAVDEEQRRRQIEVLERLLDLAARAGRPVNLHSRRADRELVELAAAFTTGTGLRAVLHWFTHSEKMARRCADAGLFISVGPSILSDARQADVARAVHPDLLLVETDSPVVYAGREASPAWAARVAQALAGLRGEARDRLRERLAANLSRFLGREGVTPGA